MPTLTERTLKKVIIPPGKPFKTGYVESFHSRMREELLDAELFESLERAREEILNWIVKWYNLERLHSALGYRTPFEVFKKWSNLI